MKRLTEFNCFQHFLTRRLLGVPTRLIIWEKSRISMKTRVSAGTGLYANIKSLTRRFWLKTRLWKCFWESRSWSPAPTLVWKADAWSKNHLNVRALIPDSHVSVQPTTLRRMGNKKHNSGQQLNILIQLGSRDWHSLKKFSWRKVNFCSRVHLRPENKDETHFTCWGCHKYLSGDQ